MGKPTVKKESLETLKSRGLVLAMLVDKKTKAPICMCYQEQVDAVAELMVGEKWKDTHDVVESPPAIILSDIQVLLAMAPVMQVKMPRGGAAMGQMFSPARGGSSMPDLSGDDDDDDVDVDPDDDDSGDDTGIDDITDDPEDDP